MNVPTRDITRMVGVSRATTRVLRGNPLPFTSESATLIGCVAVRLRDMPRSAARSLKASHLLLSSARHCLDLKKAIIRALAEDWIDGLIACSRFVIPQYQARPRPLTGIRR